MAKQALEFRGAPVNKVAKKGKAQFLRCRIYANGNVYEKDIEPSEMGTLQVDEQSSVKITPGSVLLGRDGLYHTTIVEGLSQTVNYAMLALDDPGLHPMEVDELVNNNLVVQEGLKAKSMSRWGNPGTWMIVLALLGLIFVGFLIMKSIGDASEAISQALSTIQANSGGGSAATAAGHQPIAPGA